MPHGVHRELLLGEKFVQAHQFLVDDAAGADVLMADFRVAHLAVRQTDVQARGLDERHRILGVQHVVRRLLRQLDRIEDVLFGIGILAPAITDDQEDGRTG